MQFGQLFLGTHVALQVAPPTAQTPRLQSVSRFVIPTEVHALKLHNGLNKIFNSIQTSSIVTFASMYGNHGYKRDVQVLR
jgi:hypothetical protein